MALLFAVVFAVLFVGMRYQMERMQVQQSDFLLADAINNVQHHGAPAALTFTQQQAHKETKKPAALDAGKQPSAAEANKTAGLMQQQVHKETKKPAALDTITDFHKTAFAAFRLWIENSNPIRFIDLKNTTKSAAPFEKRPAITTLQASVSSVTKAGLAPCMLTGGSYRCNGPRYEKYLHDYIVKDPSILLGKAGSVLPKLKNTLIIFMGDSFTRQVVGSMLCDLECPSVHTDEQMQLIVGEWPDTGTRVIALLNPFFKSSFESDGCPKTPTEFDQEFKTAFDPFLKQQKRSDHQKVFVVLGTIPTIRGHQKYTYMSALDAYARFDRLWPRVATIVTLFPWVTAYMGLGPGNKQTAIPQLKEWCTTQARCVKLSPGHNRFQGPGCAGDFKSCVGEWRNHQCMPGTPNVFAGLLVEELLNSTEGSTLSRIRTQELSAQCRGFATSFASKT